MSAGGEPELEEAELRRFGERTATALAACVLPDGRLLDPASGGPAPDDHYAASFAALALALREAGDPAWRQVLARWAGLPAARRGHAPFNRLAVLLLRDTLQHRGPLDDETAELLERALASCRTAESYPSNNWVLLARACALLESAPGHERSAAAARFSECVSRWFTPAGGFIDGPPGADDGPPSTPSTPITYHAKALLVLLLVRLGAPESCPETEGALARGLTWLLAFTDEAGRAGGFGRSSHALFGYGCMLALAAHGARSGPEHDRRAWALGARRLRLLLESMRRDDGLLWITLNPQRGAAGGWDDYMHLVVYNAWAAGLLAWLLGQPADQTPLPEPALEALGERPQSLACDERAGLLAVRGPRGLACLSLQGQPVQGFDERHVDLRSGGMSFFHVVLDGQPRVAPPVRVTVEELLAHPELGGWTPVLQVGAQLYGLQRFERVERHVAPGRALLVGHGTPTALHAASAAFGSRAWLGAQLDHYVAGGQRRRRRGLAPPRLDGHAAAVALVFDAVDGWFAQVVALAGRRSEALLLNPGCAALLPGGVLMASRHELHRSAGRGDRASGARGAARAAGAVDAVDAVDGGDGGDGAVATGAAEPDAVAFELPSSMAGGTAQCGGPLAWPEHDLVLLHVRERSQPGAERPAAPLSWDAERGRLVLPWAEVELLPARAAGQSQRM